jgi:D-aspartate ligase
MNATAPILLADADYYGTLAATRSLGARSIPVHVASDRFLALSRWSRFAARTLACPPLAKSERFIDWLCDLGAREPGMVLYPTSDDAAYLYAIHADELSRHFRTYQPEGDSILRVLDKKRLYAAAKEAGLETPETWFPEGDADVESVARAAVFPVLIKSRTQALSRNHSKGVVVGEPGELVGCYREFVRKCRYGPALLARFPDATKAMIQSYVPNAAEQIYMLACFVDRTGSLFASRGAMKILQIPRTLGIGVCFEDVPLEPALVDGAKRLAQATGYFGAFSMEFIVTGGRRLLIDHNPRFYNQLAFDVARGLPLPEMVYAAATGATSELGRLVSLAHSSRGGSDVVFCNTFGMRLMLLAQSISGRVSAQDRDRWRRWREDHRCTTVCAASAPDDSLPAFVDAAAQLYACARHPRAFVRGIVLDQATF